MTRLAQLFALIIAMFLADAADACSCAYRDPSSEDSVREARDRADVVFVGTAETVETQFGPDGVGGPSIQTTVFLVKDSWKGEKSTRIITKINVQCCICGYSFEEGQIYLIFGYETDDGFYSVSICSLSRPFAAAGDTIRTLDELKAADGAT